MGYGAEQDWEYDYRTDSPEHEWMMADGTPIDICNMTTSHLRNAIRHCKNRIIDIEQDWTRAGYTFSHDAEVANDYYHSRKASMESELRKRTHKQPVKAKDKPKPKSKPRGKTVEKQCLSCGGTFHPRVADVNRGWGKFCNKSCKATHQESRTHQMKRYLQKYGNFDI